MLYLNACVIAKYTWDTNKTPRTLFCTRGDAVTELRDPGYSRVWPELSVSCRDELDALRQLWTPARNRGPQRPPTQACAIRTPELLRPPRKIRDSGYSESQSRGRNRSSTSQSRIEIKSRPQRSACPTRIQSESRKLWADFSKQRKQNKSGTFKRCDASRNGLLPPSNQLAQLGPLPNPSRHEAEIQVPISTVEPGSARLRGTEAAKRNRARRLGAGTLFQLHWGSERIPPRGVTRPAPWGRLRLKTKTRGLLSSGGCGWAGRTRRCGAVVAPRWGAGCDRGCEAGRRPGRSDADPGAPLKRLVPDLGDGSGRPRRAGSRRRGRHGEWASRAGLNLVVTDRDRGSGVPESFRVPLRGLQLQLRDWQGLRGCFEGWVATRGLTAPGLRTVAERRYCVHCSAQADWTPVRHHSKAGRRVFNGGLV